MSNPWQHAELQGLQTLHADYEALPSGSCRIEEAVKQVRRGLVHENE